MSVTASDIVDGLVRAVDQLSQVTQRLVQLDTPDTPTLDGVFELAKENYRLIVGIHKRLVALETSEDFTAAMSALEAHESLSAGEAHPEWTGSLPYGAPGDAEVPAPEWTGSSSVCVHRTTPEQNPTHLRDAIAREEEKL